MSNQLAPLNYIQEQKGLFMQSLTDTRIKWEKESQFAYQALQNNPYLDGIAQKNPASLQNAIINIAAIGITLNPASKLAYLVPRDNKVCLDISYMGLLHLAQDAGAIVWGQCKLVHENDSYTNNGLDKAPSHSYSPFGDRGQIVGGYCTVKTPNGEYLTEEMPISEIIKIRDGSVAYKAWQRDNKKKCPWVEYFEEMARKTIVKRASKYWPKVDRLDNAIEYLNTHNDEGIEEKPVTASDYQVEQIKEKCEKLSIDLAGILRVGKVDSLEELDQVIAGRYVNRLNEWLGIKDSIDEMREAFDQEDYDYFYQVYSELSDIERESLQVAPTKGGVLTVEQRKILDEKWSEDMKVKREAAESA